MTTAAQNRVLNAWESSDAIVHLLTLTHSSFSDQRFTSDTSAKTSNSLVYSQRPFEWARPTEGARPGSGQLTIWNGDKAIGALVDLARGAVPIGVSVKLVFASDLDTTIKEWGGREWRNVRYDDEWVSGQVSFPDWGRETPGRRLSVKDAPGINF